MVKDNLMTTTDNQSARIGPSVRLSGVELLKLFAILMIVVFHVIQTLVWKSEFIANEEYIISIHTATTDVMRIILTLLCYLGSIGNAIFFVCSAWFLLDSKRVNTKKMLFMELEIWLFSVAVLIASYLIRGSDISKTLILRSLFPTSCQNNWYLTCYLLFYPIHTVLNRIIYSLKQRQLLIVSLITVLLYVFCNYLRYPIFFGSFLMNWIAIYFVMGYIKLYMKRFQGSAKANLICLFTGIFGNIAMTLITNVLGLNIGFFSDKLTYWCSNFSPFTAMIGISSLNLALRVKFSSGFINRAAGLSMLVYIIHENILVRSYFRPLIFVKIYEKFGYSYILLWVFGIAAAVFVVSLLISFIYSITLRPIVSRAADRLYCLIKKPFDMTIDALMKITSL